MRRPLWTYRLANILAGRDDWRPVAWLLGLLLPLRQLVCRHEWAVLQPWRFEDPPPAKDGEAVFSSHWDNGTPVADLFRPVDGDPLFTQKHFGTLAVSSGNCLTGVGETGEGMADDMIVSLAILSCFRDVQGAAYFRKTLPMKCGKCKKRTLRITEGEGLTPCASS